MTRRRKRMAGLLGLAMVVGLTSFASAQGMAPAAPVTEAEAQAIAVDA